MDAARDVRRTIQSVWQNMDKYVGEMVPAVGNRLPLKPYVDIYSKDEWIRVTSIWVTLSQGILTCCFSH
jgi:hypothetical protein